MATRHVALQYLTRFHCIGPACEDNCCGGWTIPIDQVHHDKLRDLMTSLGEQARFDQAMAPPPGGVRSKHMFAVINPRDDGKCHFLTDDRSCEIHGKHGEPYLADICSTYPRRTSRAGSRFETTASVSCPEVARLVLLADDACDLVPCDPALEGRGALAQVVDASALDPYSTSLDLIRGTMFGLLTRREYSMRSRLFFLATFGDRLAPFLVEDSLAADQPRLLAEIATIEAPETLAELDAALGRAGGNAAQAAALVVQLLSTRLQKRVSPRFRQLFTDVMKEFAGVTPDQLGEHLAARRDAREALVGPRLELYLENYCRNWVMYEWYVFAPSVAVHVQRHLVKVAALRLLLLGHPGLEAAAAEGPDAVDRLAVEVCYLLTRTLEPRDAELARWLTHVVGEAPPLAVAVALLQI